MGSMTSLAAIRYIQVSRGGIRGLDNGIGE